MLGWPVRLWMWLLVIRLISSSTGGIPESSWRVLLLMYQGALKGMRSILDCILCRAFVLDGLYRKLTKKSAID